jgi:putative ABC transport system permease protein
MSGRVPIVRRQLLAHPGRSLAGLAGIAAALLLIIALQAIFAGMQARLTAYIDRSGADIVVAQSGVDTMHMTESTLPGATTDAVAAVPGVARVVPVLYAAATLERGPAQAFVYLIAERTPSPAQRLVSGVRPGAGELVIDRGVAGALDAWIGDEVEVMGARFRISGEVDGTASVVSSVSFVSWADLARILGTQRSLTYLLTYLGPGADPAVVRERIEQAAPWSTATRRADFASAERRVVGDMSTDIVRAMIIAGFVIGVAVASLVAYGLTLAQLRDYAVLRAIGMRPRSALYLAAAQLAGIVALAFVLALGIAVSLAALLPKLDPTLVLVFDPRDLARALGTATLLGVVAAVMPILRVARVDPVSVFRR